MPPKLLSYKYEESKRSSALSGYAGLPVFLDFLRGLQIDRVMRQAVSGNVTLFA